MTACYRGEVRMNLMASLGEISTGANHVTVVEAALDEIAAALERALDITALSSIAGIPNHLSKGCLLLMLWTAPPPARECH